MFCLNEFQQKVQIMVLLKSFLQYSDLKNFTL